MKRNQIIVLLIVAAGVIGWALFRPERLFVNAKVNESLPSTASTTTTNVSETTLASGNFHDRGRSDSPNRGKSQASVGTELSRCLPSRHLNSGRRTLRLRV